MDGHEGHAHAAPLLDCYGLPTGHGGGTMLGHVGPGCIFLVWGLWWAASVAAAALAAARGGPTYAARASYGVPGPAAARHAEAWAKVVLPLAALSVELYFDHPHFQALTCGAGTPRAGAFDVSHANNWQHAASYPAVVLAGVVDLAAAAGAARRRRGGGGGGAPAQLPGAARHAALALAFGCMALLMATHKKHAPLDAAVHALLALAMGLAAAAVAAEAAARRSPAAGAVKAWAMLLLGGWMVQVGRIRYGGAPRWAPGSGAEMYAPPAFVVAAVLAAAAVLAVHLAAAALPPAAAHALAAAAADADGDAGGGGAEGRGQQSSEDEDLALLEGRAAAAPAKRKWESRRREPPPARTPSHELAALPPAAAGGEASPFLQHAAPGTPPAGGCGAGRPPPPPSPWV